MKLCMFAQACSYSRVTLCSDLEDANFVGERLSLIASDHSGKLENAHISFDVSQCLSI